MKLYFNPQSRATRVRWMLEELGTPHELVPMDFNKGDHKKPEYMKLHPMGSLPAVEDNGKSLFESAAIVMHLADKHPEKKLAPAPGTHERGEYYQWILFAMVEAEQPIVAILQHTRFLPEAERSAAALEKATQRFKAVAAAIDARLKGREYLVGNAFTAADVVMGGVLVFANRFGLLADFPGLLAYVGRLTERPAAKKALAA
ncbi:MAG: glutathione S-transferase family protein [Hyalangium sp.]|uniref:glutathione S-transferase family protein n=1 Tax=Hyalangium sp. TaxID=2028555 RepID=UPI0038998E49